MFAPIKKVILAVAAIAALALGGSAIAGAASSSSTSSSSSTQSGTPAPSATNGQAPPAFNGPAHGTAAHEDAEKGVTGDAATKAQAAAVKSVGSGTAGAVTSDYTGSGYEVTVTKSDGTQVDVHLDSSFNAMQGPGGHGGPPSGGPAGAPPAGSGG